MLAAVKSLGTTLITSQFRIDELRDVLARDRLQPYIHREEAEDLLYHLEAVAVVVAELPGGEPVGGPGRQFDTRHRNRGRRRSDRVR